MCWLYYIQKQMNLACLSYILLTSWNYFVIWVSVLVAQSCLCDTTDCSWPDSCIHGIFQARILQWIAIAFSRGFSQPRDPTRSWTLLTVHIAHCRLTPYHLKVYIFKKSFFSYQNVFYRQAQFYFCTKLHAFEFIFFTFSSLFIPISN